MAMILVITVLAALLAVGAIGLSLQLNSTKSAALVKDSRSALYCAEAGIASARNLLTNNRAVWNDLLAGNLDGVAWYPITGDIDDDGVIDYRVTIKDDADDADPTIDNNATIIVISVCEKYGNAPSSVMEVITFDGNTPPYRNQSGQGSGNTGNAN